MGGAGKLRSFLRELARAVRKGERPGLPDLLVVALDGNCQGHRKVRASLQAHLDAWPRAVAAVADPHIERWLLLDPEALQVQRLGVPELPRAKCERDLYKQLWRGALEQADRPVLSRDGVEHVAPLLRTVNLGRAARRDPALGAFLGEARRAMSG